MLSEPTDIFSIKIELIFTVIIIIILKVIMNMAFVAPSDFQ